jgi:hypothetical protein
VNAEKGHDLAQIERELVQAFTDADPKGPDASKIVALHRGHDAYITFHSAINSDGSRSDQPNFQCAIRADELEGMFPQIANAMMEDAYFSVHAFQAPKHDNGKAISKSLVAYRTSMLQYLCAVHVDIDCYTRGMKIGQAIGQVFDAQKEGKIPSPSVYASSGRGLWLFWFLKDENDPSKPPRANYGNQLKWASIERKVLTIFNGSGADANALKKTQITRIPGSVNTKSGEPVSWLIAGKNGTTAFTYTLSELASFFGVQESDENYEKASRKIPNNAKGWKALYKWRLKQFEFLRQLRGGFKEGHRANAIFLYANILKGNHFGSDMIDAVEKMASECDPPYSINEATKTAVSVSTLRRARSFKNTTIGDSLQITHEEHQTLVDHFGEKAWPYAGWGGHETAIPSPDKIAKTEAKQERDRHNQERDSRLIALCLEHPDASLRDLSRVLRAEGFEGSSLRSISKHLARLGLTTKATEDRNKKAKLLALQTSMLTDRKPRLK